MCLSQKIPILALIIVNPITVNKYIISYHKRTSTPCGKSPEFLSVNIRRKCSNECTLTGYNRWTQWWWWWWPGSVRHKRGSMCCDVTQTAADSEASYNFLLHFSQIRQVPCTIRCYHTVARSILHSIKGAMVLRKNSYRQPWNTHFSVPWEKS